MQFNSNQLNEVSQFLQSGNLLAYPTEAVWGIGCDPFNEQAVQRILTIKNRPYEKGMIVVTADTDLITDFMQPLPQATQQQIIQTWQSSQNQATTYLFRIPNNVQIPNWVTGGRNTLAIRVIRHPLIAALCRHMAQHDETNPCGFLISTSCNPNSLSPATNFTQACDYFGENIGYLLGDTLGYTQPSQIKDAMTNKLIRV